MQRQITGFHRDEAGDWIAELSCGHTRHVRHKPPWEVRPWVVTEAGRLAFIGRPIECTQCDKPDVADPVA